MPPHYGKFIAYYRVSTDRQGKSGLGLEAQRKAVLDYLNGGAWELIGEFTEIESGKRSDRPELEKVPRGVKKQKAKLIIAKLDRLSAISHLSPPSWIPVWSSSQSTIPAPGPLIRALPRQPQTPSSNQRFLLARTNDCFREQDYWA